MILENSGIQLSSRTREQSNQLHDLWLMVTILELYLTNNMQICHFHEIGRGGNVFSIQTWLIIIDSSNDSEDTGGAANASGASLWPLYQGNSGFTVPGKLKVHCTRETQGGSLLPSHLLVQVLTGDGLWLGKTFRICWLNQNTTT